LIPSTALRHSYKSGVKAGGDRQELHEEIRIASMEAGAVVKGEGKPNDLLLRIKSNPKFAAVAEKVDTMIDPAKFVGRAPQQVMDFIDQEIDPVLAANADLLAVSNVDSVNV
jgi:adenylosuccinate lyase